jgi:hypothetical protein
MAFFNGDIGQWERRRFVDENCDVVPEVLDPAVRGTLFGSFGDIDIYENAAAETNCSGTIAGTQIEEAPIEDVANLNVNYFLQVGAADLWPTYNIIDDTATFTIRVTGLIEPTGPGMVPVPATAPLLVAGLGGIAFAFRRRATRRKAA